MSLWILDTDHTSLFLAGNESVIAQVAEHSNNIAITIITVQKLFNGWNEKLNDPRQANNLSNLYIKLWQTTEFFKIITILNFIFLGSFFYPLG
jgi:tRNA(fMet)-specific endonuclease VapC